MHHKYRKWKTSSEDPRGSKKKPKAKGMNNSKYAIVNVTDESIINYKDCKDDGRRWLDMTMKEVVLIANEVTENVERTINNDD